MTIRFAPVHLLAASLALGLALANLGRIHVVGLAGSAVAIVALAFAGAPALRLAAAAALLVALGWWFASARLAAIDHSPMTAEVGRAGRVVVVVTTQPVAGSFEVRAQGAIRSFDGEPMREPVELQLHLGRSPPQGAVLDALVVVQFPPGPEHGFDDRTWLRRHGVHVVLRVDEWTEIGARGGLGGIADRLRRWLGRSIAPGLSGERRAVLEGIVLGDGTALSPGLRQDFQASGLYHILAVSGQNVVLVAGGALFLAWLLGFSRWVGEVGALAGILGYVVAVGPSPSVIRAGIAGSLASLAWLSGRLRDAWYALLVAAIALLAWNPYNVYDPGFQLSFAAVVAIFTVVPAINRRLERAPLPRTVRLGIAVSIGCGLVTAPILWMQFHYLPILGVPANALAEPAMPILLGLSFATAGVDAVAPGAASVLAWLNGWTASYIALCARAIGSLPFAEVSTDQGLAALMAVVLAGAYGWYRLRPAPSGKPP
jgi:competence protein ComEC